MQATIETTREMLVRTCTIGTYDQETARLQEYASAAPTYYGIKYTWDQLCGWLTAYQNLNAAGYNDLTQRMHIDARLLAVGDWMNRVHDTADGAIAITEAVAVPDDYPFSRTY